MSYLLLRGIYSGPTGNIGIGSNNPQSSLDISGNVTVTGSILPSNTLSYDLGTPTKRWRDIYLSGNTIDLDGALIQKEVGGGIKIADASGNTLDGKFNNIDISGNATINGNTTITGNTIINNNATINGIINQTVQLDISGSILPTNNLMYDLGAPDKRWNDLYLSGNTIDLSGTLLSRHTDGSLMVHDSNSNMVNLRANNIIAEGNLTVSGTTTTINSTTVTVQDPIITLGSDITNTKDKGVEFKYDTNKIGFFGYDDSTGNLTFLKDASNNSEVFSGTQGTIEGATFKSTIGSGTAPLTVTSSTLVTNLNADMLDGLDNTKFMRTDANTSTIGNLGIGTNNPRFALDVSGDIIITGNLTTTGQIPQNNSSGFYNSVYQFDGATYRNPTNYSTNVIRKDNITTNITGFLPTLLLYNNNGADNTTVGIEFACLEVPSGSGNNGSAIAGIIAKKDTGIVNNWSKGSLHFFTKNYGTRVDAMSISPEGNVGIGTALSLSRLTVKNGYSEGQNGGICIDATDGGVYNMRIYSYFQAIGQIGYAFKVNNIASSTDAICLGYNGNVGIGIASPQAKLHVNGGIMFSDASIITRAPRIIYTEDTRSGCPPSQAANTAIMTTTFTLSRIAYVFTQVNTIGEGGTTRFDTGIYVDNVQLRSTLTDNVGSGWKPVIIHWAGTLAAGSHTIDIRCSRDTIIGCGSIWGSLVTMIYE